jgi:putative phosphoribosyl transferase
MGELRILSRSDGPFQDREEAGRLLAGALPEYRGREIVVLGIPRGGVIVARALARALDAEMDIVLAHKLGVPGEPELAMGSVAEDGKVFLTEDVVSSYLINQADIEREKTRELAEINRRIAVFRNVRPKVPLKGRTVIVTDDGIATGATARAAFWAVQLEHPAMLVAAIPVGPEDVLRKLARDVGEMVCLRAPPDFFGVGQFYREFAQVEDGEVVRVLREEAERSRQIAGLADGDIGGKTNG